MRRSSSSQRPPTCFSTTPPSYTAPAAAAPSVLLSGSLANAVLAAAAAGALPAVGANGRRVEAEGNVLLASVENMQLDVGEGKEMNLEGNCSQLKLLNQYIKYLCPKEGL